MAENAGVKPKEINEEWNVIFDKQRVFPRLLILLYTGGVAFIVVWFTGLKVPTAEQTTFCTIYAGLAPVIFGLYVNSGGVNNSNKE